ncbi:GNAT family N-acetyltransferase [Phocaeicola sp.]
MGFLADKCVFSTYSINNLNESHPFQCGVKDLDSFFLKDAFLHQKALLCKNYCFVLADNPQQIVVSFTLSNDSIKKVPNARKKKVEKNIPHEKHYSSYPAVMIGRLGVDRHFQNLHIGTEVLNFIKAWFLDPLNKTGCRFVLVDSYNRAENIKFYQNNGFSFLFGSEVQEKEFRGLPETGDLKTRLMFFDLIELAGY